MKQISIVVPVLNEEANVTELIQRFSVVCKAAEMDYEIIFIDDHSIDATVQKIQEASAEYPVAVYAKKGKRGKAYSVLEGFEIARYPYVAMIDADLQYPPEELPAMYDMLHHGKDIVVANRITQETSWSRRLSSRMFNYCFSKFLHDLHCDVQSGFKVFKKRVIEEVKIEPSPWTFDLEFLLKARNYGYVVGSHDIVFAERVHGASKIIFWKAAWEIGWNSLKLKMKGREPLLLHPESMDTMAGAGMAHSRQRFVTHTTLHHSLSAITTFSKLQHFGIYSSLILVVIALIIYPMQAALIIVAVLSSIYFIDVFFNLFLVLRSLKTPPEISSTQEEIEALTDRELPIYTILCPLYREAHILPGFVKAISSIEWPKEKLDVMLLLEEDDQETVDAARAMNLPEYIRIMVVPHSMPKTKPKACNYGLCHARGSYVVIYDAEDIPDTLQLKKAYLGFKNSSPDIKCLQAKLNYFNPHHNMLTRMFTAEYSLWFDISLPGLQSVNTSIPLGGTSNHFRTKDLLELQGWDPFNVTEDCDLGVRIFKQGYRTAIIDSVTLEEANSQYYSWIKQRSRWIKGYMQTYLVHMRHPLTFFRETGIHAFMFQLIVGGKLAFILLNPFLWLATIAYFVFFDTVGLAIESLYPNLVFYMAVTSLIVGNFLAMFYYMLGCAKRGHWSLIKYVFLVPLYWLMVSIAGFMALYQLFVKPHYWEKTEHGLHLKKRRTFMSRVDGVFKGFKEKSTKDTAASSGLSAGASVSHEDVISAAMAGVAASSIARATTQEADVQEAGVPDPVTQEESMPQSTMHMQSDEVLREESVIESNSSAESVPSMAHQRSSQVSSIAESVRENAEISDADSDVTSDAKEDSDADDNDSTPTSGSTGDSDSLEALDQSTDKKSITERSVVNDDIRDTRDSKDDAATDVGSSKKESIRMADSIFASKEFVKKWRKVLFAQEGIFLQILLFSNFLNFAFNAFLGRYLNFTEFALVSFVNTMLYMTIIFFSAFSSTINHETAYGIKMQVARPKGLNWLTFAVRRSIMMMLVFIPIWIFVAPWLAVYFHIETMVLYLFTPTFLFGILASASRGYIQGQSKFVVAGLLMLLETIWKFVLSVGFVFLGYAEYTYLSIPLSVVLSGAITLYVVRDEIALTTTSRVLKQTFAFPMKFYIAALVGSFGTLMFLNLDILLAKHYLEVELAGQYSLIALIGKMVFFFSTLPASLMITLVSRAAGDGRDTKTVFRNIYAFTILIVVCSLLGLILLGKFILPLLFGEKVMIILPYLNEYIFGFGMFSLSSVIVTYHLALKRYLFSLIAPLATVIMGISIVMFHADIDDIVDSVAFAGIFAWVALQLMHFLEPHFSFLRRGVQDFKEAFSGDIPEYAHDTLSQKNILIFNWRDRRHKDAGGAEEYTHEIAKEWVKQGHHVTLFCGNDSLSPRYEIVDGINIVRRGGFYLVYLWAFVYYVVRFRGKYDIIVDCQNGVPFFTPLYVGKPIFCLMHHVHKEVFFRELSKPQAHLASFLEEDVMSLVYRNTPFITVSESSREEMLKLGLGKAGISVIHPGVSDTYLQDHSVEKNSRPTFLYLGRLKSYKSVDVLIRAFAKVMQTIPNAQLIIAGSGEEELVLRRVAWELGLNSDMVSFRGFVSEEEKLKLLQSAWVLVLPSYKEGWGIVCIEANACGTPVIASNVAGLRDSVVEGRSGFLLPYGDVEAFADKMEYVISDEISRMRIAQSAREWANGYAWHKSGTAFMHLILQSEPVAERSVETV